MNKNSRGFTLIELLVVIAIIAILSVVVILTLNPAELLRQARDSNRVSDLSTMNSALGVYYADVSSPTTSQTGKITNCYTFLGTGIVTGAGCGFIGAGLTIASTTSRAVNGTGWLPIPFTGISSGAPIGNLPADPVNGGGNAYRFVASSTFTYELNADMESAKQTAATGVEGTDGGSDAALYEVGTAAGLAL